MSEQLTREQIEEVICKHMRHIELSPGAGKVAQDYAIATCEDILFDLAALRSDEPSDEPVAWMFTIRYTGKGKTSTFAAIDYTPQEGEELVSKTPLYPPRPSAVSEDELKDMEARKDAAYYERNQVVAGMAALALQLGYRACRTRTAIEGWSEDWHGCVYIELPTGQVSWHFHDSHAHLFDFLPESGAVWDGHDTETKYRRVLAIRTALAESGDKHE